MAIKILLLATLLTVSSGVEFQILNKDFMEIWVGIQGNPGHAHLNNGGMVIKSRQNVSVTAPRNWAGRFWARTFCNPSNNECDTGDCGKKVQCNGAAGIPPASSVEITLQGHGGLDYYNVSLVDGFNIEVAIEPLGGRGDGGRYSCKKSACQIRLTDVCPEALKVRNSVNWMWPAVVGCNSACNAFNTDQYCCRGAYGTPSTCRPSTWPVNYPEFFKSRCPDAHSYAYDDRKSTFTCKAEKYLITFGN